MTRVVLVDWLIGWFSRMSREKTISTSFLSREVTNIYKNHFSNTQVEVNKKHSNCAVQERLAAVNIFKASSRSTLAVNIFHLFSWVPAETTIGFCKEWSQQAYLTTHAATSDFVYEIKQHQLKNLEDSFFFFKGMTKRSFRSYATS